MVKGSLVAIITPFDDENQVNYDVLKELLNWHVSEGTDGIIILGTTGEAATLSEAEKLQVIKFTVDVIDHRIPVIAGTGSNNTSEALRFSKAVEALDVDGLLIVTPYYNKGNVQGLINHYQLLNDELTLPIIVYNVPSRTGLNIPVEVVKVISKFERIIGIKEASGDMSHFTQIRNNIPEDFLMYTGTDDLVLPALSLGAAGVISVAANVIPKAFSKMVHDFHKGDVKASRDAQLHYLDLIDALFIEVNPIPVKDLMNIMGKNVGGYRLPLAPPTEKTHELLKHIQKRYNL